MTSTLTAAAINTWRKGERERLIALRLQQPAAERETWTQQIIHTLEPLLRTSKGPISFYFPFKGEPDLRPLMRQLAAAGLPLALPTVPVKRQPMVFRPWTPGCKMEPGILDIPIPATDEQVVPTVFLAPVVGFDARGFRLGYGGGYFDRTLAHLPGDRLVIGIGFDCQEIPTIHPQGHDIPMTMIVTQSGRVVD
ncbi:MAG TPA: 5-formyltetrahydrofolate cyclo-ligase [Dongiaceae bacterium]|nr:5-formyltetrahydrofolate cyclo-ligase [Dongiaceae bacterium]